MYQARLTQLGILLPPAPKPIASYVPAVAAGSLLYVSGQLPLREGKLLHTGKVPDQVSIEAGQEAARQCVLNALAIAQRSPDHPGPGQADRAPFRVRSQFAGVSPATAHHQWGFRAAGSDIWRCGQAFAHCRRRDQPAVQRSGGIGPDSAIHRVVAPHAPAGSLKAMQRGGEDCARRNSVGAIHELPLRSARNSQ